MRIFGTTKWKEIFKVKGYDVDGPVFSPDDTFFTTKTYNSALKIMFSGEKPLEVIAFSTDELASLSRDIESGETYRLTKGWRHLFFEEGRRINTGLAYRFTSDSQYLVVGDGSDTSGASLKCFPLYPQEMIKAACQRVGRNLSHEEWKRFFGERPEKPICPDIQPDPGIDAAQQQYQG